MTVHEQNMKSMSAASLRQIPTGPRYHPTKQPQQKTKEWGNALNGHTTFNQTEEHKNIN